MCIQLFFKNDWATNDQPLDFLNGIRWEWFQYLLFPASQPTSKNLYLNNRNGNSLSLAVIGVLQ